MDTPMSVFSMETVFSYMEIEKIWNIRRENLILQRFIDTIKPTNMKKWYVSSLEINGDRIGRRKRFSNDPDVSTPLNGTKLTRWLTCDQLILKNITREILQKSIFSVVKTLCKNTSSLDISSSDDVITEQFFTEFLRFVSRCEHIRAFSLHLKNLTECQLIRAINALTWNNDEYESKICILSLNASAEITPKVVDQFLKITEKRSVRVMMITSGEEDGEEVRLSKEAVLHMFQKCEDSSKEEQIVVEMMEKSKADEIFDELQRRYPRSYVEDDNGRMHFLRNLNGSYNKSFRVLTTYR